MKFFYTCKQAHKVISEGLDHDLNFSQKMHLAIHLSVCDSCANFKAQIQTLHLAMKQLPENMTSTDPNVKDQSSQNKNHIVDKK